MIAPTYGGIQVVVSPALPLSPTPGTWARRYVRHGMADVLEWLGEDVGLAPDALTHVVLGADPAIFGPRVELEFETRLAYAQGEAPPLPFPPELWRDITDHIQEVHPR